MVTSAIRQDLKLGLGLALALSLTGCASFVASNTAPAPLGVASSERSFAQVITDNGIVRTARVNLYKLDDRFKLSRVNIESFHSVVLLTGQVPDPHLKELAEQNVKSMRDVQVVHNYITIGDKVGYNQIVQDGWLTTTIRAGILRSPNIRDTRVKVTTEAGVVYVMGRLTAAETDEVLGIIQQVNGVERIISLIDTLPDATTQANPIRVNAPNSGQSLSLAPVEAAAPATVVITPMAIDPTEVAEPLPAIDQTASEPEEVFVPQF
ncbi:MAG: BON domain-containing protein [Pseudomonadota bacterium]|nr:BON domain-containing protein [Pseudomonadota bacterium]